MRSSAAAAPSSQNAVSAVTGMRGRNNSLSIDGVDNRDETTGGSRVAIGLEMVQEFRVSAKSGAVQQTSNTVSADFLQKKKHTLKVELRMKGQSANAGMPQGLYPDSQIVLTLK